MSLRITPSIIIALFGHCIDICPVEAISKVNDKIITDANLCIKCCACVKECPENARIFEFSNNMAKILYERNGGKRKEPELFFLN
ncbi:MAG: 4Fe-4S binding protein [Prolixibacteraceae bacterium]|nr:4Fe-4S binding protein [Prolixibacteraceae bacterium]